MTGLPIITAGSDTINLSRMFLISFNRQREILQVELRGLLQIGECFLHGVSLADSANFRAFSYKGSVS